MVLSRTRTVYFSSFFFNDTATTEIYTLSLHDALPISQHAADQAVADLHHLRTVLQHLARDVERQVLAVDDAAHEARSEEHTSELQSRQYLVCRLLLEKKKKRPPPLVAGSYTADSH